MDERLAAQTKARTDPVRSDNRWQRQAELSPKKNYYASSRRAAHCQVLLRLDLILAKSASKRLSGLTGSVWAFWMLAAGR